MANLKNCIVTPHSSQEHFLDIYSSSDVNSTFAQEDAWQQANLGVNITDSRQIGGMPYKVSINNGEATPIGILADSIPPYKGVGGVTPIVLVIEPNNTVENLSGKDYEYVVAANTFRIKGKNFDEAIVTVPFSNPQYSFEPLSSYMVPYEGSNQPAGGNYINQTGNYFKVTNSAFMTAENHDPTNNNFFMDQKIDFLTLYDTGIPNTPGNKVVVKVFLKDTFEMPAQEVSINIDFDMDAVPYKSYRPNLTWILTNQIWPNYNVWKLMGDVAIDDSFDYLYFNNGDISSISNVANNVVNLTQPFFSTEYAQNNINFENDNNSWEALSSINYIDNFYVSSGAGLSSPYGTNQFSFDSSASVTSSFMTNDLFETFPTDDSLYDISVPSFAGHFFVGFGYGSGKPPFFNYYNQRITGGDIDNNIFRTFNIEYHGDNMGWTSSGYNNWLENEFIGKQNPSAIKNCTITQMNTCVDTSISQDENTWTANVANNSNLNTVSSVTSETFSNGEIKYKITPDDGYTITAFNFCILPKMTRLQLAGSLSNHSEGLNIFQGFLNSVSLSNQENHPWIGDGNNADPNYSQSDSENKEQILVTKEFNKFVGTEMNQFSSNELLGAVRQNISTSYSNTFYSGPKKFVDIYYTNSINDDGTYTTNAYDNSTLSDDAPPIFFFNNIFNSNNQNKLFVGWRFNYPMTFEPFKTVNLDNVSYEEPWRDSDGNLIPDSPPIGFKIDKTNFDGSLGSIAGNNMSGSVGNQYPGGVASWAKHNSNSGIEYVDIKNTIPHSMSSPVPVDNEIIVTIKIDPETPIISEQDKQVFMLNLWGYARPILPIAANQPNIAYGMPSPPVQVNFDLIDTGNSGNIDIVRSSGSGVKIKKSTIRSGFVDQKDIYKTKGYVKANRETRLATIIFEAISGNVFKTQPSLSFENSTNNYESLNKNLKLVQAETSYEGVSSGTYSDSKFFKYYLVYTGRQNIGSSNRVKCFLNYKQTREEVESRLVSKVNFGSNIIKPTGETRPIKVYGTPGLVVDIAVNKVDNILDSDENIVNTIESSILNRKAGVLRNLSEIATLSNGVAMTTVTKTIPQSGNCTVFVDFPSINIKKTKINGAVTRGSTITLDDNSDIRVGDIMYFGKTRLAKVTSTNTSNQVVTDQPIVISDNVGVVFKREAQYNINVYCNNTTGTNYKSGLSSRIASTDPTFVLNQFNNPALCLEILAGNNHSITHVDDVAVAGAGDGIDYYVSYLGRVNATYGQIENTSNTFRKATIKLTINAKGSQAFTANRVPHFGGRSITNIADSVNTPTTTDFVVSDFTNTNPLDNGGTEFLINNASSVLSADGGTANGICTLTFDLVIEKWGTKDFKVTLDLDDLLTSA